MAILSEARALLQLRRSDKAYTAAALNRYLNQVRGDMCSRHRWTWLRKDFTARTVARDTTSLASISAVLGSRVVTLSTAAPNTIQGKRLLINSRMYEVIDVESSAGTGLLLDQPFIDATATYTGTILYDEIALPPGSTSCIEVAIMPSGSTPLFLNPIPPSNATFLDPNYAGQPSSFTTTRRSAIVRPLTAPTLAMSAIVGGPGNALVFYYAYSYVDVQTGAESPLSPVSAVFTTTNTNKVTVTFAVKVGFYVRIYRSRNAETDLYMVAQQNSSALTSYNDASTDIYLFERAPAQATSIFLRFHPTPDAVYQIRGIVAVQMSGMTSDNDRAPWDESWDTVWLDGAEAMMLESADEQGRANQARQRYEAGVQRMIAADSPAVAIGIRIGGDDGQAYGRRTAHYGAYTPGGG